MNYSDFETGTGFNKERLSAFAKTPGGVAFLAKYLHPPGGDLSGVEGIPDRDSLSSTTMEWRLQHTISRPGGVAPGIDSWNVLFFTLPNMRSIAFGLKWLSGQDPVTEGEFFAFENTRLLWNEENQVSLFDKFRPLARSDRVKLNAAALSNQGMCYGAQIRCNTEFAPQAGANANLSIIELGRLPFTGGDVTMLTAKSYSIEAEEGAYTPRSYTQPSNLYLNSTGTTTAGNQRPFSLRVAYIRPDGTRVVAFPSASPLEWLAPPWDPMSVGVYLFTGLSLSATLELATVLTYEVTPTPDSAWLNFQTPGAQPDLDAMEAAYTIRQRMPDMFPAKFNFWGALASLAGAVLPKLGGMAMNGIMGLIKRKQEAAKAKKAAKAAQGVTRSMNPVAGEEIALLSDLMGEATLYGKRRRRTAEARRRRNQRRRQKKKGLGAGVPDLKNLSQNQRMVLVRSLMS